MRTSDRDTLLFFLAMTAGSSDGWSYFGLGHAFVANMTGNTVLVGVAVFDKSEGIVRPLLSLVCYLAGVAAAAFLNRHVRQGSIWSRATTITMMIEAVLIAGAEVAWVALRMHGVKELFALLGCLAFAIGLQSGAMLQLKIPGAVTTYITGTWTNLISGLARLPNSKKPQEPNQKVQFAERLIVQGGILAVYILAAVLTGWVFVHQPLAAGALAAASVWTVALYAAFSKGDSSDVSNKKLS